MTQPLWQTPAGSLGTIPEGVFYSIPLVATSSDTVYYQVIAGSLPTGIRVNEDGILTGVPQSSASIVGIPAPVQIDTTSKFAIRAYTETTIGNIKVINGLADRTFSITVTGQNTPEFISPPGLLATYFDATQVTDIQVETYNPDIYATTRITLVGGALPPGLTISTAGLISGYINPTSIVPAPTTINYAFTLKVSSGVASNLRTFNIVVYSRAAATADNTYITADNTFVTSDVTTTVAPIITTPIGSIGTVKSDNFFAFQFRGEDFAGYPFKFIADTTPPGLTLDPNSGWLYGYIPAEGLIAQTYQFTLRVYQTSDSTIISNPYNYSLTITGPISSEVTWLVPNNLGTIDNGATSTFYVAAITTDGLELQYNLASGSNSNLPQGLQLLSTGEIVGRVSFNTFALDGGATTFDAITDPTTFDLTHIFTVNAFSVNNVVNVYNTFSITVNRKYNEPYDNLYMQAMPPQDNRTLLTNFLQNITIFTPSLIYRYNDPNFGVAKNVTYYNVYGLTAVTLDAYVNSLNLNYYWKNLTLGAIETAQALDSNGNILYEIVYSRIIDNLVNNEGTSVGKSVELAYTVDGSTTTVYPNSLQNMRNQVIDEIGQISNILPRWMQSKQANGQVLGFTPAWVIAYCNPGQSGQIAYNIKTKFGEQLNLIDYQVDRYELDNLLTHNWNRVTQQWNPTPPLYTRFDDGTTGNFDGWVNNNSLPVQWTNNSSQVVIWENSYNGEPTTFDGNSLQFIDPVDMYSNTQAYDKYLLFPKQNITNTGPLATVVTPPYYASWINNSGKLVNWVNSSADLVEWINN